MKGRMIGKGGYVDSELVVVSHSTAGGGSARAACSILRRCETNGGGEMRTQTGHGGTLALPGRQWEPSAHGAARDYIFSVSKIYSLDYQSISKRGYWKMER